MSDLSPECAPKRTSADHSELWVHALIARRANHFVFSEMACPAPFAKIFPFSLDPNQMHIQAVPSLRGAIARRHERGAGCGGRESVRRARQSQGEMNLVSEFAACKMIGALADGEAVWF
jgi:hypothetical protein